MTCPARWTRQAGACLVQDTGRMRHGSCGRHSHLRHTSLYYWLQHRPLVSRLPGFFLERSLRQTDRRKCSRSLGEIRLSKSPLISRKEYIILSKRMALIAVAADKGWARSARSPRHRIPSHPDSSHPYLYPIYVPLLQLRGP